MSDFDLDLRAVEEEMDGVEDSDGGVVLGVLDGTTRPERWASEVTEEGSVLVLAVEGGVRVRGPDGHWLTVTGRS